MTRPLYLAVALDGAGWHPAAWRAPDARPADLFRGSYWVALAKQAEWGAVDLVTIEDALGLQPNGFGPPALRSDEVQGRLDALLLASWIAPSTRRIGLVPTVTTTHTEPFHVSTALATLDHVSHGRAGWRPQVSGRPHEAEHFGRRAIPSFDPTNPSDRDTASLQSLFDEAADAIEVVRALWDSWQDDAEIRDAATGRFIDRNRVHRVGFKGKHFSVLGPSITPRPPQGQPLVTVLAHQTVPYRLAAAQADIVYVTPHDDAQLVSIIEQVREAERFVGRVAEPLKIWVDLVVAIDGAKGAATARAAQLDELHGQPFASDALLVTGTAREVADRLIAWHGRGVDGFRLRPLALPHDLVQITDELMPRLTAAGVLGRDSEARTLRSRLGFESPRNRYLESNNLDEDGALEVGAVAGSLT